MRACDSEHFCQNSGFGPELTSFGISWTPWPIFKNKGSFERARCAELSNIKHQLVSQKMKKLSWKYSLKFRPSKMPENTLKMDQNGHRSWKLITDASADDVFYHFFTKIFSLILSKYLKTMKNWKSGQILHDTNTPWHHTRV